jgi:hypothetical protein
LAISLCSVDLYTEALNGFLAQSVRAGQRDLESSSTWRTINISSSRMIGLSTRASMLRRSRSSWVIVLLYPVQDEDGDAGAEGRQFSDQDVSAHRGHGHVGDHQVVGIGLGLEP